MTPTKKIVAYHATFWVIFLACSILSFAYKGGLRNVYLETSFSVLSSISIAYLHYFFLRICELKRNWKPYPFFLILLLVINSLLKYAIFNILWPLIFHHNSTAAELSATDLVAIFSWQLFQFLVFSWGYWMAERLLRLQIDARLKDQTIAKKNLLELENAALRAQINPHFFINTLNMFRTECMDKLPETAEGIGALTEFLGSSIVKPDASGKIPLYREIAAIESLLDIFKRRFSKMRLNYVNDLPLNGIFTIVPHVLVTFVENALKHGYYMEESLVIKLCHKNNELVLYVHNRKGTRIRDDSRGIGLAYIRQQLETHYKDHYQLDISNENDYYTITLEIPL